MAACVRTALLLCGGVFSLGAAQIGSVFHPQINLLTATPGASMGNGTRSSKVVIDFYVDLVCPDSARAFPTLQDVVAHFSGEDLAVFLHQFPLPYHRNGHLLAQGFHQVLDKAPGRVQDYVAMCFRNISEFRGSSNTDKSERDFTVLLADLQEPETGIPSLEFRIDLSSYGGYTVSTWKYGVRKGVAGTPWFFVNDIDVGVNPNDEVGYESWVRLINALLRFHIDDRSLSAQYSSLSDLMQTESASASASASQPEEGQPNRAVAREVATFLEQVMRDRQGQGQDQEQSQQSVGNSHQQQQPVQGP